MRGPLSLMLAIPLVATACTLKTQTNNDGDDWATDTGLTAPSSPFGGDEDGTGDGDSDGTDTNDSGNDGGSDDTGTADGTGDDHTDADADGVAVEEDCDDADPGVGGPTTWFIDYDSDGFGSAISSEVACDAPALFVANDQDCDDLNPTFTQMLKQAKSTTIYDQIDEDVTLTYYADTDDDGFGDSSIAPMPAHRRGYASLAMTAMMIWLR